MSFPADTKDVTEAPGPVDIAAWAIRVAAWDGLLPILVLMAPILIDTLLPNNRFLSDFIGGGLPIVVFIIRLIVGMRHIWSNGCSKPVRELQTGLLWVAVFLLVFVDTMLIISHQIPGALIDPFDQQAVLVVVSIYLPCLAVAMYPGRKMVSRPTEDRWD